MGKQFSLNHYLKFINDFQKSLEAYSVRLCSIGNLSYHDQQVPIYASVLGRGLTSVLITAGVHGEEQAAAFGLLKFIQKDITKYLDLYTFTIIPVINPIGFTKKTRRGSGNKDLNRYFGKDINFPENQIVLAYVTGKKFEHHFDLHEDIDVRHNGAYMYENGGKITQEEEILHLSHQFLHWVEEQGMKINYSPTIYSAPNNGGVIHRPTTAKLSSKVRKLGALVPVLLASQISRRGTTLETSMWYPFEKRVEIQRQHLNFWLSSETG